MPQEPAAALADDRVDGGGALLAVAGDLLDCPYAMLWIAHGQDLLLAATHGLPSVPAAADTLLASALGGRAATVVPDASVDPRLAGDTLVAGPPGIRFFIATRLTGPQGELIGVLGAGDHRLHPGAGAIETSRMRSLADLAGHAMERTGPDAWYATASDRCDALTGLPNRETLFATIDGLRARGVRLGLALMGLDNFRAVNEALGHVIGDTVLQVVACRAMAWLPATAHLARFSGDEFAIVFPAEAGADIEPDLLELMREVSRPCEIEHQRVHVEACIGLAFDLPGEAIASPRDDRDSIGLPARAALAMRHAKRGGSLQLRRFSPSMREEAINRRHLDLELRRAFRDSEFELHYQPQIDLASGRPAGAEALLRWRHPERGLLLPAAFIDALARSTIASAVGTWVLEQACHDAAGWAAPGDRPLKVGVNLFPSQFDDDALVDKVDHALAASGLHPTRLEIELTETIALRDDGVAEKTLLRLRSRGVRVSYDDFGTGHASLSMLHRLPVDRVKIDRSFVRDLAGSRGDKAIVRSIALIAKNFDMHVIAEGVETDDQAALLREFGCQEVQGFLYSEALAPRLFDAWLAAEAGNHG
ncbi:sensor domain-containing phosphodiesterase [Luteimonas sp. MJ246]